MNPEESENGNSLGRGKGTPSTSSDVDGLEGKFAELGIKDQTPQKQNDNTKRKDDEKVKRKLFGDSLTDDSKEETDDEEATDGDGWLQDHPWNSREDREPNRQDSNMEGTIGKSQVYTVSENWQRGKNNVDLKNIYSNLPAFVSEMKGLTCREELEQLSDSGLDNVSLKKVGTPHIREIVQKKENVQPQDKRSRPAADEQGEKFMAYSLPLPKDGANQFKPSQENYWYLDCEYMLTMYLPPEYPLQWFKTESGKRIREINPDKEDKRWVFIPSFRRANIALLDWPQDNDEIITKESTIRILVVRPSEFKEYLRCCGHMFPVVRLPQDEIGAGYPRLWIQKIALRLKLDFIWMIDDSVECFYEYHPTKKPPNSSYKNNRRRPFGSVFKRIEKLVKEDKQPPIAAMSPKRFMGAPRMEDPFVCAPPRIAVLLNIKALKSKEVYYRPELQAMEDMIFGYECEKNGLKVFIDNRVHLQDKQWNDTGARSLSVRQQHPEAAKSNQKQPKTAKSNQKAAKNS